MNKNLDEIVEEIVKEVDGEVLLQIGSKKVSEQIEIQVKGNPISLSFAVFIAMKNDDNVRRAIEQAYHIFNKKKSNPKVSGID